MGFIIQLQEDLKELNSTANDLQKHCSISGKFTSLSNIQKGEVYAVLDDDSQKWVRYDTLTLVALSARNHTLSFSLSVHPLRA
jgi:hypothetical protein